MKQNAQEYQKMIFKGKEAPLKESDPEFVFFFQNFCLKEAPNAVELDEKLRMKTMCAVLLGCGGVAEYEVMLEAVLNVGVDPIQVKEILYQAVAYLGIGRVFPFFGATNRVMANKGISLPLEPQGTTTPENRIVKGNLKQVELFGEGMRGFETRGGDANAINRFLAGNCFGDYYTRNGLSNQERELYTFCYLYAQGGCEPQLLSHTKANLSLGNSRELLLAVLTCNVPYIGYPRTLNALRILDEACNG